MFEIYHFSEAEIALFALILVRVSSMMVTLPIFGTRTVPNQVKILLSFAITFILFPLILHTATPHKYGDEFILLILREAFIGVFMGFLTRMIFMAVQIAGQILSFSIGLSAAQLVNPAFGDTSSIVEQFEVVLATLLFLAINGHHMFFEALYSSFDLAPVGLLGLKPAALNSVTIMAARVFEIGVKMAGPMMAVVLFLNISLGVIGRAVPQINVFIVSFPVNILVGLFIFMVSIPICLSVMETDFAILGGQVLAFIKGF